MDFFLPKASQIPKRVKFQSWPSARSDIGFSISVGFKNVLIIHQPFSATQFSRVIFTPSLLYNIDWVCSSRHHITHLTHFLISQHQSVIIITTPATHLHFQSNLISLTLFFHLVVRVSGKAAQKQVRNENKSSQP